MNADRIVALAALIAAVLAGSGLPSKLGLGPEAVTLIGGLIVGLAAVARASVQMFGQWRENLRRRTRGEEPLAVAPNWRDIVGAFLGVMAVALGIDGIAVDQLDVDTLASLSSLAAAAFAWQRGGGGSPPASSGLVLLVLGGACSWASMDKSTQAVGAGTAIFLVLCFGVALTPERPQR